MINMKPNKKLDEILNFIKKSERPIEIHDIYYNYNKLTWPIPKESEIEKITLKEIERILIKLENEKFIEPEIKKGKFQDQTNHYKITFDGDFFITKGGYQRQKRDEKLKRNLKYIEASALVLFAGIGAAHALFEIIKLLKPTK